MAGKREEGRGKRITSTPQNLNTRTPEHLNTSSLPLPLPSFLDVLDVLTSLVEKSLLIYDGSVEPARYRMLETIRQYGLQHLAEGGEEALARNLHQKYYSQVAKRILQAVTPEKRGLARPLLFAEGDNLVAALEFCMGRAGYTEQAMEICDSLCNYWKRHDLSQGRKWTSLCLSLAGADHYPKSRANLLSNQSQLSYYQGDFDEASQYAEESLAIARSLDRPEILAGSIRAVAMSHIGQQQFAQAIDLLEECRTLFQQIGDIENASYTLCNQGHMHKAMGNAERAYRLKEESLAQFRPYQILDGVGFALQSLSMDDYLQGDYALAEQRDLEALQINRDLGNKMWESINLLHLGWVSYSQGNRERAIAYCHASLRLQYEVRRKQDVPITLQCLGFLAFEAGQWKEAVCLWGADSGLREKIKMTTPPFHPEEYQRRIAETEAQLGAEAFERVSMEGRAMSFEQCIEYGLAYE